MRKNSPISLILLGALLLSGCGAPSPQAATPDPNAIITEAAATAAAELTRSAGLNPQPTRTQPPAATTLPPPVLPTATVAAAAATATNTPKPDTGGGSQSGDAASFVADVTVPDNTYAAPGAKFVKTWRIKNTGTTTWTPAYGLVWIQGEKMGVPDLIPVPKEVRPNEEVEISVDLTAPDDPGTYQTFFRLRNESGQNFRLDGSGDLWVKIIVGLPSTATSTPGETPEATATITLTPTPE
jgi:hypothetical protein